MKKITLILLTLSFCVSVFAQKTLPEIKVGTIMNCSAFVQGQEFPLELSVKSINGPVSIGWAVNGYGEGSFDMTAKSLESATKMLVVTQPSLGATTLSDDETFGIISKAAFKSLSENKSFTYDGINFKIKTPSAPFKIGNNEIDVTHVISDDAKLEIWILNNPNFPLIVQSSGMPTDIVVQEIK